MNYLDIINKVSENTGIHSDTVNKIYKAYWCIIRKHIENLNLKEDLSEEEFSKIQTNINIPSLGKLTCTYNRYKKVRERFKRIKKLRDDNKKTDKNTAPVQ